MKSRIILLACFMMALVCSCDEDEGLNSHRIVRVTYTNGDYPENDYYQEFGYADNKLIRIMTYDKNDYGNWDESFLWEISYTESTATATRYDFDNGYQDEYSKSVYQVQDGRIIEHHLYWWNDQTWENWAKWTFQYSGSDMISYDYFYAPKNVLELRGRATFTYVDNKLMEFLYLYDDGEAGLQPSDKETFSYGDQGLSRYIDFNIDTNGGWVYSVRCDYSYSGSQLYKRTYTHWLEDNYSWDNVPYSTVNYSYDGNGYLIQKFYDDGDKYDYEYEEGHGNAKFFYYDPAEVRFNYPTIKSARPIDPRVHFPGEPGMIPGRAIPGSIPEDSRMVIW